MAAVDGRGRADEGVPMRRSPIKREVNMMAWSRGCWGQTEGRGCLKEAAVDVVMWGRSLNRKM